MRCPFLREAQVKYCRASAHRKMIARAQDDAEHERCMSSAYVTCPAFVELAEDRPAEARCPYLEESLVQYCAAAGVTKYIPYSEASLLQCGTDRYRYCEAFLSAAGADASPSASDPGTAPSAQRHCECIADVHVPAWLAYARNHLWLDSLENGRCHIGIDAFLARVLGGIQRIHFLTARGTEHPTAVLTVSGVDLHLTFPLPVNITATNSYLRACPEKMLEKPYGGGWLFEGVLSPSAAQAAADDGAQLLRGTDIARWMSTEIRRLTDIVHERIVPRSGPGPAVMMDGGFPVAGLMAHLNREDVLLLYHEFFSPHAHRRSA